MEISLYVCICAVLGSISGAIAGDMTEVLRAFISNFRRIRLGCYRLVSNPSECVIQHAILRYTSYSPVDLNLGHAYSGDTRRILGVTRKYVMGYVKSNKLC
jgi:hypothetical protein